MILEEETFRKFGYYSCNLSSNSNKKILAACDDCRKVREIPKQEYRAFCLSCSKKGKRNPSWRGGRIKQKCEVCTKIFFTTRSRVKSKMGRYCSRKCFGVALSKKNRGENNHNWKGGLSFEPYCIKFDNTFKEYIRNKFNNVCFLCDKTEEENGRKLSVHHVNYNKACGCAKTEEDKKADDKTCQFVPLCMSCNSRVNFNRDLWERKIKAKLKNKLNGWYI